MDLFMFVPIFPHTFHATIVTRIGPPLFVKFLLFTNFADLNIISSTKGNKFNVNHLRNSWKSSFLSHFFFSLFPLCDNKHNDDDLSS